METDPVCGLDVPRVEAEARSEFEGRVYFFCSKACQRAFEREPALYAGIALQNE